MTDLDRRSFLTKGGLFAGAALASTTALGRLDAHAAWAQGKPADTPGRGPARLGGYGELSRMKALNAPAGPEYFALPEGFRYWVFSKVGDLMADGTPVPRSLDGMGAFAKGPGVVRLIRNHENRNGAGNPDRGVLVPAADLEKKYDPTAYGGTTTLDINVGDMTLLKHFVSAAGTTVNCAGGEMLGDVGWITSEETVNGPSRGFAQKHGYNFIVPMGAETATFPQPLGEMGRFAHEACAVDPATGMVYETEDSGNDSGFYRFVPNAPSNLAAGGRLEMLAVRGKDGYSTLTGQRVGQPLSVRWVPIPDPDPDLEGGAPQVADQGIAGGAAVFNRLEGIWWGDGRCLFNSTSGGDASFGQVWEYRPGRGASDGMLTLVYESPGVDPALGRTPLDSPDNLNITPRGGVLLCEDDSNPATAVGARDDTHPLAPGVFDVNRLIGLGDDGQPFEFAVHTLNDTELAGACFAPNAPEVLFVNTFGDGSPGSGATFAITGPWERGAL